MRIYSQSVAPETGRPAIVVKDEATNQLETISLEEYTRRVLVEHGLEPDEGSVTAVIAVSERFGWPIVELAGKLERISERHTGPLTIASDYAKGFDPLRHAGALVLIEQRCWELTNPWQSSMQVRNLKAWARATAEVPA